MAARIAASRRTNYAYATGAGGLAPGAGGPPAPPEPTEQQADQETTVPKSRARSKAVYTPPSRSAKAKVSPPWLVPAMLGSLIVGLVWIVIFYVSQQDLPIKAFGAGNLVIGFGFLVAGVVLSTKWR
jgi:Cell division protein CrgA